MPEKLKISRADDRLESDATIPTACTFDTSMFVGEWLNTDSQSDGIAQVVFTENNGSLLMRVFGAADGTLRDWGQVEMEVFADRVDSHTGTKFCAVYDFEFVQVRLHGWVKLGVLVIALFYQFKDSSGRSSYFTREFLYASKTS